MSKGGHIPVLGILGGVGAGKSTVAAEMGALGCVVIDGDRIGHAVLERPEVRQAVLARWGDDVMKPDGSVDRAALGRVVFGDAQAREALNALTWPLIRGEIQARIDKARSQGAAPAIVLDAAIMIEAGWDELCDDCIFVQAPNPLRAARVENARGWDEAAWSKREKTQISLDKKASRCKYRVDNSSDLSRLREQVRRLIHEIQDSADRR